VLNGAAWRKSSYSSGNAGNCVEVALIPNPGATTPVVALRDSKDPSGPALVFPTTEWRAFATAVQRSGPDLA
jgi:Domain of unknown function (DUF397)